MKQNEIYTYEYSQPDEYRFSLDSVFLAQCVANEYQKYLNLKELKVLDICSGCGVIGLELNFHLPELTYIDFLEVQTVYESHFNKNIKQSKTKNAIFRLRLENYEILRSDSEANQYNLIVSNPPYFFKNEGLLSPNDFKNRCRFFLDSDFKNLMLGIHNSLTPKGSAFVLLRPGVHHGRDLFKETQRILENLCSVQIFAEVRGTNVIRIIKL